MTTITRSGSEPAAVCLNENYYDDDDDTRRCGGPGHLHPMARGNRWRLHTARPPSSQLTTGRRNSVVTRAWAYSTDIVESASESWRLRRRTRALRRWRNPPRISNWTTLTKFQLSSLPSTTLSWKRLGLLSSHTAPLSLSPVGPRPSPTVRFLGIRTSPRAGDSFNWRAARLLSKRSLDTVTAQSWADSVHKEIHLLRVDSSLCGKRQGSRIGERRWCGGVGCGGWWPCGWRSSSHCLTRVWRHQRHQGDCITRRSRSPSGLTINRSNDSSVSGERFPFFQFPSVPKKPQRYFCFIVSFWHRRRAASRRQQRSFNNFFTFFILCNAMTHIPREHRNSGLKTGGALVLHQSSPRHKGSGQRLLLRKRRMNCASLVRWSNTSGKPLSVPKGGSVRWVSMRWP